MKSTKLNSVILAHSINDDSLMIIIILATSFYSPYAEQINH